MRRYSGGASYFLLIAATVCMAIALALVVGVITVTNASVWQDWLCGSFLSFFLSLLVGGPTVAGVIDRTNAP